MDRSKTLVLAIDDQVEMLDLLLMELRKSGFTRVERFQSGIQAMAFAKTLIAGPQAHPLDHVIAFCDWHMPEIKGIDVLKAFKADATLKQIRFIMVTTENERAKIIDALVSGADGYILKPYSSDTIEKTIAGFAKGT